MVAADLDESHLRAGWLDSADGIAPRGCNRTHGGMRVDGEQRDDFLVPVFLRAAGNAGAGYSASPGDPTVG
jgi:hypothetical protein